MEGGRGPIVRTDSRSIPPDAVLLTENEALQMQWQLLYRWKPRGDVWPFTYGVGALASAAGLSGFVINKFYRKKLNLFHYGRVSTYIPLVLLPSLLAGFLHHELVSRDIVLYKKVCPVCMETRAMAVQTICGIVYPMIMAPAATLYLAQRTHSHPIPPATKDLLRTYVQLTKPVLPSALALLLVNLAIAIFISFEEVKAIHKINTKLEEIYKLTMEDDVDVES